MAQNDQHQHEKKPWESNFEGNRDEAGNYSRTVSRRNTRNNTMITTSLLVIFVVIIVGTIALYFVSQHSAAAQKQAPRVAVSSRVHGDKKTASKPKSIKYHHKTTQESAQSVVASSQQQPQNSAQQSGGEYATVQAGQGMYRVAVNHGLTVAQLKQLNPGLTTLSPGQQVRVRE
ncbi:SAG1386/EF1546 family surface-associated protein [Ligilactobacillus sp. LYQ60]|uniref:SAG1386/EF1546 family surface-associated protein n=1 Tax=unclassified Ligilactobacillus TaxID=2767920 RepID=UPI003853B39F